MAVHTNGKSYGIPKDLIFSFPVVCKGGKYHIVENITISDYYRKKLDVTIKELVDERTAVESLLK